MKFNIVTALMLLSSISWGQTVTGTVYSIENSEKSPLIGASVYWKGTTEGTLTDVEGKFSILLSKSTHDLIVSFVGFKNDTIHVHDSKNLEIVLAADQTLEEVVIRTDAGALDRLSPLHTHTCPK